MSKKDKKKQAEEPKTEAAGGALENSETKEEVAEDTANDLKSLVEKNIKWSQVIYNQNKKINHRLTLMIIGSYLRLALIVIPLILAIFYLPPVFRNLWEQYQPLLQGAGQGSTGIIDLLQNFNIDSSQIQGLIGNH